MRLIAMKQPPPSSSPALSRGRKEVGVPFSKRDDLKATLEPYSSKYLVVPLARLRVPLFRNFRKEGIGEIWKRRTDAQDDAPNRTINAAPLLMNSTLLIVGFFTLYPVAMLLFGSLRDAPPGEAASFTLAAYREAYANASTYRVLLNSLVIAGVKTVFAVTLGVFFAWVVTRTDTPYRRLLETLVALPFFVPPILTAMAWAMLGNPTAGSLNKFFMLLFGLDHPLFNVYSYAGIIWHMTHYSTAFVFLLIVGAFRAMDPALEDASRAAGAGGLKTFFRVTLPLMAPAIMGAGLLAFIRGLEAFESALFFGLPARIFVFTTEIYSALTHRTPADHPRAMALAALLMAITFTGVLVQRRIMAGKKYFTITGNGYRPRLVDLGAWKWATFGLCVAYFFIALVLPVSQLLLSSFFTIFGLYDFNLLTLDNYRQVFSDLLFWRSLTNSLVLAAGGAVLCMLISALIAYIIFRTKFWGKAALDFLSWMPWSLPGMVLALGLLWAFIPLPGGIVLYGTIWILLIAYLIIGLPVGVRSMAGTIVQISQDLEESSRACGASWWQTFVKIYLALLRPGFTAGAFLLFFVLLREVSASVLLYSPGNEVLSVTILKYWEAGRSEVVSVIALIMLGIVILFRIGEAWLMKTKLYVE
jgi:iron(III) transport system permease protein